MKKNKIVLGVSMKKETAMSAPALKLILQYANLLLPMNEESLVKQHFASNVFCLEERTCKTDNIQIFGPSTSSFFCLSSKMKGFS